MSEDTKGLPDVKGLEQFIQDKADPPVQEKDPAAQDRDAQGKFVKGDTAADGGAKEPDWAQFKNKDGSLNQEALLKSYKEIQGYATKVSQENKQVGDQLKQVMDQFEIMRLSQAQAQYAQPAQPQQANFDTRFVENPENAVQSVAQSEARKIFVQAQIEGVLNEEQIKNPQEFNERYQYAMVLKNQYPQLTQSAAGVRKLFELSDQVRKEELKKQSYRAVQVLFGDDVDMEKFKSLIKKAPDANPQQNPNLAYMPDTTMGSRSGADTNAQRGNQPTISDAVQKGDVDTVIQELFKTARAR